MSDINFSFCLNISTSDPNSLDEIAYKPVISESFVKFLSFCLAFCFSLTNSLYLCLFSFSFPLFLSSVTFIEMLPKEKKQKEEKTQPFGQSTFGLHELLRGETNINLKLPIHPIPGSNLELQQSADAAQVSSYESKPHSQLN
jgi:hypothetical protein